MDPLSLVISLCALAVSVISVAWAMRSSGKAEQAASDSKESSDEALKVARESKTIAEDSRQLAVEANDLSRAAEQRETEHVDIRWDGGWLEPGVYRMTNAGRDTAFDVTVNVQLDSHAVGVSTANTVVGGGYVDVEVPEARAAWRRDTWDADAHARLGPTWPYGGRPVRMPVWHFVTEHADWKTQAGKPDAHDLERRLVDLTTVSPCPPL